MNTTLVTQQFGGLSCPQLIFIFFKSTQGKQGKPQSRAITRDNDKNRKPSWHTELLLLFIMALIGYTNTTEDPIGYDDMETVTVDDHQDHTPTDHGSSGPPPIISDDGRNDDSEGEEDNDFPGLPTVAVVGDATYEYWDSIGQALWNRYEQDSAILNAIFPVKKCNDILSLLLKNNHITDDWRVQRLRLRNWNTQRRWSKTDWMQYNDSSLIVQIAMDPMYMVDSDAIDNLCKIVNFYDDTTGQHAMLVLLVPKVKKFECQRIYSS